jgi:hypothetical protein
MIAPLALKLPDVERRRRVVVVTRLAGKLLNRFSK